jgi:hypothetical protein
MSLERRPETMSSAARGSGKLSSLLMSPPSAHSQVTSKLESLLYVTRRDFHGFSRVAQAT